MAIIAILMLLYYVFKISYWEGLKAAPVIMITRDMMPVINTGGWGPAGF